MQIQAGKKVNDVTTVSDEAFALLVLKNIWEDMLAINIDEYYCLKKKNNGNKNETRRTRQNTDFTSVETTTEDNHSMAVITGCWTSAWHGSCRYGGWSLGKD